MRKLQEEGGLAFFQRRMKPINIGDSEYGKAETIQVAMNILL